MNLVMNQNRGNKNKNARALLVALFLVFYLASFSVNIARAADATTPTNVPKAAGLIGLSPIGAGIAALAGNKAATAMGKPSPTSAALDKAGASIGNVLYDGTYALLSRVVLPLMGKFAGIAATIFTWAVNPAYISGTTSQPGILNLAAVKNVWTMVRDLLNMTFILILLFAAFCTVFQVQKWNLKKVWLSILINALLVNFSFPIARFFIDISNTIMYFFFNGLFKVNGATASGSAIFANFGAGSSISDLLQPPSNDMTFLLVAIIFTFIFAVTLLVLAVMFVIRLVALAMLVMFSPIGFVGYIFPKTEEYANDWWSELFKYSFFGPIMAFMIMVALSVELEAKNVFSAGFQAAATQNSATDIAWMAKAAFFSIPIIILWTGMGVAQKMKLAGADMVVGAGQKFAKWAGKKASGYNYVKKQYGLYKGKRDERQKDIDKNRWGGKLGDKINQGQDRFIGGIPVLGKNAKKRAENRTRNANKEDIKKKSESHDGTDTSQLITEVHTHINDPRPKTKDQLIDAAGKIKAGMSRGREWDQDVTAHAATIKADIRAGAAAPVGSGLHGGSSQREIKDWFIKESRKTIKAAEEAKVK